MDVDGPPAPPPASSPAPLEQSTGSGYVPYGRQEARTRAPGVVRKPGVNPKVHGPIKDVPVLSTFTSRLDCSYSGVHAPNWRGIHSEKDVPAYSIVLSGGYEDDEDKGETFIYTGEGGRSDKTTNGKQTQPGSGPQVKHQEWTGGNKSLQLSHITGKPVRVVRGGTKFRSRYAPPNKGYRYDGLYKVTSATRSIGKSGFFTCQFTFERLPGQPPLPNEVIKPARTVKTQRSQRVFASVSRICQLSSDDEDQLVASDDSIGTSAASFKSNRNRYEGLKTVSQRLSGQPPISKREQGLEPARTLKARRLKRIFAPKIKPEPLSDDEDRLEIDDSTSVASFDSSSESWAVTYRSGRRESPEPVVSVLGKREREETPKLEEHYNKASMPLPQNEEMDHEFWDDFFAKTEERTEGQD